MPYPCGVSTHSPRSRETRVTEQGGLARIVLDRQQNKMAAGRYWSSPAALRMPPLFGPQPLHRRQEASAQQLDRLSQIADFVVAGYLHRRLHLALADVFGR